MKKWSISTFILLTILSACGQTGSLYLPESAPANTQDQDTENAAEKTEEDSTQ